ncbi:MAG TPA: DUF4373 domain-containing protein [Methanosarcinales archaeon]|nr:DUF4373 domain-containing protein [Methanosarcinales archaeon]
MARPLKAGLDYFPLDVHFDDSVELFEAECGLEGIAILTKLWQKIYSNGYFTEWGEDNALLFSRKINTDINKINSVINVCLRRNIFSLMMYDKYNILTSRGIQKRYISACIGSKRKSIVFYEKYLLVDKDQKTQITELITEETELITEETELTQEESTQRKLKERKLKERKLNIDGFFESVWILYPKKEGKGQVTKTQKDKLLNIGFDEIKRSIDRYVKAKKGTEKKYLQNGSTFFNSGYIDYLDNNYNEEEEAVQTPIIKPNGFNNHRNRPHDKQTAQELEDILIAKSRGEFIE